MVTYKHQDYLEYMTDVKKYSQSISTLNDQWDNIKLLCEIDCPVQSKKILPSMAVIQTGFYNLQQELIDTLVSETFRKIEQKISSKAQVAVDILIRNLYERTADVGFLATDDDIRRFVSLQEKSELERELILNRLRAYVAKYSVYEEIVILDNNGTVLANLDQNSPIFGTRISDPLLEETLASEEGFLETFRRSPLQPGKEKAHIFSSKISVDDEVSGIICLCFRFDNEMDGIFQKLSTDYDGSVILIVDGQNRVLASSDENHVPAGICVEPVEEGKEGIVYYRGVEYIVRTVHTQGYQGYYGLGWKGHVMIPLRLAFREKAALQGGDPSIMTGLMSKADSFSTALNGIVTKTQEINHSLKRIVYNGQILTKESDENEEYYKLKPLLGAIGKMGNSTGRLFAKSIQNLFATVVTTNLADAAFTASLCIDIMDRNLYERSDDCRWWALNSTFRTVLAQNRVTEQEKEKLTKILRYINSLYTVYSNLFLFDRTGRIVAVSNPEHSGEIGLTLSDAYVRSILTNAEEGKYFVSPFEQSGLYGGQYTYIYGASVTDISDSSRAVGGIGIVFDGNYQFRAMLHDALKAKEDTFAVFADCSGKVISSTLESLQPGGRINLPADLLAVESGTSRSEILVYEGNYYAVGCGASSGYREYKISDGYRNDVLALVFEKLADYDETNKKETADISIEQADVNLMDNQEHIKLVTFAVAGQLFALEQSAVLEAIDAGGIVSLPGQNSLLKGAVLYNQKYVAVVDTHRLLGRQNELTEASHLLVIKPTPGTMLALEADELNNVLEVNQNDLKAVPEIGGTASSVQGIVCFPNLGNRAMLVLNHRILMQKLEQNSLTADWEKMLPLLEKLQAGKGAEKSDGE